MERQQKRSSSPASCETILVIGDQEHPDDGPAASDAFDRRVAEVLEHQARLLREQSDLLIATGSISVRRPAGELTAHLKAPRWWRRGELEVRAVTAGSSGSARARVPLSRAAFGDLTGLSGEIRLHGYVRG